jgi:membrane protein YdbS with pleckstrin-like domain
MRWLVAYGIVAVLMAVQVGLIVGIVTATGSNEVARAVAIVYQLSLVGWVVTDSAKLEMHKYKCEPDRIIIIFGMLCCYPLLLPMYLASRSRRLAGELPLKKKYRQKREKEA